MVSSTDSGCSDWIGSLLSFGTETLELEVSGALGWAATTDPRLLLLLLTEGGHEPSQVTQGQVTGHSEVHQVFAILTLNHCGFQKVEDAAYSGEASLVLGVFPLGQASLTGQE